MFEYDKMTTNDYVLETARTAGESATAYFINGLTGELGELCTCPVGQVENELGDVLWYYTRFLASLLSDYNRAGESVFEREFDDETGVYYELIVPRKLEMLLLIQVCKINELYKKLYGHKKQVLQELLLETRRLLSMLARYAIANKVSLRSAAINNVKKLRVRYPDGFSYEASAARADEAQ